MSKGKLVTALANSVRTGLRHFHGQGSTGSIDPSTDAKAAKAYAEFRQVHDAQQQNSEAAKVNRILQQRAEQLTSEGAKVNNILQQRAEQILPKSEGTKVQAILSERAKEITKGGRG